jgi:hypothetical protein
MASPEQKRAARRNVQKAVRSAKSKPKITHLSKRTRTALGKEARRRRNASGAAVTDNYIDTRERVDKYEAAAF